MCCSCGGCRDSDDGATDSKGNACDFYESSPAQCGFHDDGDFNAATTGVGRLATLSYRLWRPRESPRPAGRDVLRVRMHEPGRRRARRRWRQLPRLRGGGRRRPLLRVLRRRRLHGRGALLRVRRRERRGPRGRVMRRHPGRLRVLALRKQDVRGRLLPRLRRRNGGHVRRDVRLLQLARALRGQRALVRQEGRQGLRLGRRRRPPTVETERAAETTDRRSRRRS